MTWRHMSHDMRCHAMSCHVMSCDVMSQGHACVVSHIVSSERTSRLAACSYMFCSC